MTLMTMTDLHARLAENEAIIEACPYFYMANESLSGGVHIVSAFEEDEEDSDQLVLSMTVTQPLSQHEAGRLAHSWNELPRLNAAIRAVLELHAFDAEDVACGNARHTNLEVGCPDCYYPCQGCGEPYPCPTVEALEGALNDE